MLRLRQWSDMDMKVKVYISTSGDFIQLGNRTAYPFQSGGANGVPNGWTPYNSGGAITDVAMSVGSERFNIATALGANPTNYQYGATRTFNISAGKRYVVYTRFRTIDGRAPAYYSVAIYLDPGNVYWYGMNNHTTPDWVTLAGWTNFISTYTTMRVELKAYYASGFGLTDPNWGIQYTDFAILEQESTYPEPTWEEITCEARTIATRFGREKFTNRYDVGAFSVGLLNDDGEFSYDPNGTLRPGRFIKGTIIRPGETYEQPLFYGVIDNLVDTYSIDGRAITVINAVDTSSLLSNMNVPTLSDAETNTGSRISKLYQAAGWHPSYSNTQTGKFLQQGIQANGRTIRDEIGLSVDSEGGYWFAGRDGILRFYNRDWPNTSIYQTSVQAQILAMREPLGPLPIVDPFPTKATAPTICANAFNTDWSRSRLINAVSLANQGGVARNYGDPASQQKYGVQSYQRHDLVNSNANPENLDTRANDILTGFTEAILRVNSVKFRPQPEDIDWASTVFLNDVVRVWYAHPENLWGYAVVTHVQSVEHSFTATEWTMTLALDQPIVFTRFQWDPTGTYGWDANLWDLDLWDEFQAESAHWSSGELWSVETTKWGK